MSKDGIPNLDARDTEVLAEWFLYHMTMEQRWALMADHPLVYSRMFPGVPADRIAGAVREKIEKERS
jgi:hypothetical protein